MKIVFELPFYSQIVGGVNLTIQLANELNAHVYFQSLKYGHPFGLKNWSYGLTNLPECDLWITYSDNARSDLLLSNTNIKKVAVFMQSFGMNIANERKNALNPKILCLCTTKKIEEAIRRDGGNPINVGFGLEMSEFKDFGHERKNYLAILFHEMQSKRYNVAVKVADILYAKGIIEGVISFGTTVNYKKYQHPKGLVAHYGNATKSGVADVFNQCKAYLMPSVSEGLNLTPIESTLCGCPSVIVDGAIGEIFIEGENCFIAGNHKTEQMFSDIVTILDRDAFIADKFEYNMRNVIKPYTWSNVANKIKEVL